LLLRPWRPDDRQPFARMNADTDVMEFFVAPLTREQSDAFVDRIEAGFAEHGFGVWAVQELRTGAFVGFAGLLHQTFEAPFTPAFEIGYRFARPTWGQGYATEARPSGRELRLRARGPAGDRVDDGGRKRAVAGGHAQARHDP
jgi:RimJ/RimL family protein N-acetyltransferase